MTLAWFIAGFISGLIMSYCLIIKDSCELTVADILACFGITLVFTVFGFIGLILQGFVFLGSWLVNTGILDKCIWRRK